MTAFYLTGNNMNIAVFKTLLLGLAALALSGCSTLIGIKFYDSGVNAAIYNDTKHELTKSTKQVILTENLNGTYGVITDESDHFIIIAGTPHFDKGNLEESMRPFKDFLRWASLARPEQQQQRLIYNQQPAMQEKHIEFRYFPDGSPAFADVLDERFFFYKGLLDAEVKYYSYNQILELVSLAYTVTYGPRG